MDISYQGLAAADFQKFTSHVELVQIRFTVKHSFLTGQFTALSINTIFLSTVTDLLVYVMSFCRSAG